MQQKFLTYLSKRLEAELPGFEAQAKMAPVKNKESFRDFTPKSDSKRSAVLVLLNSEFELLFTLRSNKLRKHSGQISFPGGKSDAGETLEETALRETEEEVGIDRSNIKLLGSLSSLYVPPSNSLIQPYVGYLHKKCELVINYDEVSEAFFVPLKEFEDEKNLKYNFADYKGKKFKYPYWDIHREVPLWGATAIMMSEFIHIYNEFREKYR